MFQINKWLYPGIRIKRWIFLLVLAVAIFIIGITGFFGELIKDVRIEAINVDHYFRRLQKLKVVDIILIGLGIGGIVMAFRRAQFSILTMLAPEKEKEYINVAYKKAKLKRGPKIAVIGGGTGMPNALRGLKHYTANLSAIVTVADDGGSSGRLRKDYRILPPGDIRNCIVALADEEALLGRLFQYRFETGEDLGGHSFGNIFITALTHVSGDFPKAINESSKVLAISGRVLPVTLDNVMLKAQMKDGKQVEGESKITEAGGVIEKLTIVPPDVKPYPEAVEAINSADVVVIGPGSLYTSIIPNLMVPGIKEALMNTKTVKIYICNIMTQHGETDNYTVSDHVDAIFSHAGAKVVDYVIANDKMPDAGLLKKYEEEKSYPVKMDKEKLNRLGVSVVEGTLFSEGEYVRHSPELLAKMIMKLILV